MTYQHEISEALKPITDGRVYYKIFKQLGTWPAIRFFFVDITPINDICGDGDDTTADARVQIDVVGATAEEANTVRAEVMAAMRELDPPAILESSRDSYDDETRSHRWSMDYLLFPSSVAENSPP